MAVSRRLRFEVLRRDGHTCRYCGAKAPDVALTVDHVIPTTLGGSDDPANLVTACQPCNAGKTSIAPGSPLVADVEADAIRWAEALRRAAFDRAVDQDAIDEEVAEVGKKWAIWKVTTTNQELPRPAGWQDTVERFIALGLSTEEMTRLIRRTMANDKVAHGEKWRYFCGCCWRSVTELQESARLHLEAQRG